MQSGKEKKKNPKVIKSVDKSCSTLDSWPTKKKADLILQEQDNYKTTMGEQTDQLAGSATRHFLDTEVSNKTALAI